MVTVGQGAMFSMIDLLKDILTYFGVPQSIVVLLFVAILFVGTIAFLIKAYKWFVIKRRQSVLNANLSPYISKSDVDKATRFYIPTKYQNVSPSADDEPGKSHIASAKAKLLPLFLNEVFKDKADTSKYYLILADSGMGKTTFLINLFMRHTVRRLWNLLHDFPSPGVRLFPLGAPDIWEAIDQIENKQETILLLDAFDEDVNAVEDHEGRMAEILERTQKFKKIVVTCRTQFFPSDKEIPDDTGYVSFGGDQISYKFQRVYLSVFDESDIKKYLRKRFAFFQIRKRARALEVVRKSPNLVMRPMLLSYINDLVQSNRTFEFSYEIYEVLVDRWIDRESRKKAVRDKYGDEKYKGMLRRFSQSLAVNLYLKREERGGYFVRRDELIQNPTELKNIADMEGPGMAEAEIRSKSLLNRDAEGRYKFSHKSIMEYFLACELMENHRLLRTFEFDGMSATEAFISEKLEPLRNLGGHLVDLDWVRFPFHALEVPDLRGVVEITIHRLENFDIEKLGVFTNAERITIYDVEKLNALYFLDMAFSEVSSKSRDDLRERKNSQRQLLKQFERRDLHELAARLNAVRKRGAAKISGVEEAEVIPKFMKRFGITTGFWRRKIEAGAMTDDFFRDAEQIEVFLKKMRRLRNTLPKCTFHY
ncbi:MAG: hypothetical protein DMF63_16040 [Acidobacteria bacterium]|nr:MAG: hypothetical protein DMF63_16040 [Acidobacteriota bacterium]